MKKDRYLPPPIDMRNQNSVPEYYLGRLIFFDDTGEDNMRWVIYDGRKFCRASSMSEARRYCEEQALSVDEDTIKRLRALHYRLSADIREFDKVALFLPADTRIYLQSISVGIRQLADKIDNIIRQHEK